MFVKGGPVLDSREGGGDEEVKRTCTPTATQVGYLSRMVVKTNTVHRRLLCYEHVC